MKTLKKLLLLTLSILLCITAFSACGNGKKNTDYYGKYYTFDKDGNTGEWLELKSNNVWDDSDGLSGTYSIKGKKLTIRDIQISANTKMTVNGEITTDTITFTKTSADGRTTIDHEMKKDPEWDFEAHDYAVKNFDFTADGGSFAIGYSAYWITGKSTIEGHITIPSTFRGRPVVYISSFTRSTNITGVTIPSSVIKISSSAFSSLGKLSEIRMPTSVTKIGQYTFYNCNISTVYYAGSQSQWQTLLASAVSGYDIFNPSAAAFNNTNFIFNFSE